MPKGVYPRANRSGNNGIRTEVTEETPRPEAANMNVVEVSRQTDGEDVMSTTERLFGDLIQEKQDAEKAIEEAPIIQDPLAPPKVDVRDTIKTPAPKTQKETDEERLDKSELAKVVSEAIPPKEPEKSIEGEDMLDVDTFGDRKVRAKIDGREETPTFKEVLGQYQLKKHLTEAADRVGEERRRLAEERRQLQELRQQQQQQTRDVPRETWNAPQPVVNQIPQEFNPLMERIQSLEQQLRQVVEGTRPAMYESNRQRVANELRMQGFPDFLDYLPKMESHILGLRDPQEVQFYDTPTGAKSLYFQLKAQDLNQPQAIRQAAPPPPVVQRQMPKVEQKVPETRIDSASGPSSGLNDDPNQMYRTAFRRASTLGDDKEAWNDVLRQKGIIPDA
jgi:hypothetical protein